MKPPYFTISGSICDGWRVMKYTYVSTKDKDDIEHETEAVTSDWLKFKEFKTLAEVGAELKEQMKDFV